MASDQTPAQSVSQRSRTGAHLPAPAVTIGTTRRQVCAWCGVLLEEVSLLRTYMSDGGEVPDYDPAHWYEFSGAAVWQAAPADKPPGNACCRGERDLRVLASHAGWHSQPPQHGPWEVWRDRHGTEFSGSIEVGQRIQVVSAAHLVDVVRAKADVVSALDTAIVNMAKVRACLTPGMKAGTGEAAALLEDAIREAQGAL